MNSMELLMDIRKNAGEPETVGLPQETIQKFLSTSAELAEAIAEAHSLHLELRKSYGDHLKLPEKEAAKKLQKDFVNFYPEDQVNPYIALTARGPWIVTAYGAVLHDSGGYGMLGMGHGPKKVIAAMSKNYVMANIMTPSFSHLKITEKLFKEVGHRRSGAKRRPYEKFLCMNSGSEAVTVAARISDINAKNLTDEGAPHAGKTIKFLALKGGFHGRTERPALASDSSRAKYNEHLATFRGQKKLVTVEPNNIAELEQAFDKAEKEGVFFECMFMEPVMGEGDPGKSATPEFYKRARELTKKMGTLLLVDSIQAGLRANGCLSIMDYPGYEELDAPDMETYSKALNAGQYPLSVLAMREEVAKIYVRGVYGNTMTANPRALEVGCAVLDEVTPELRGNIVARGKEFLEKFAQLRKEFPEAVTDYQGTGLLCALHLSPKGYKVVGETGIETYLRKNGIGVIHGGKNALRFTPHFRITSQEVDLVIEHIRRALKQGALYH